MTKKMKLNTIYIGVTLFLLAGCKAPSLSVSEKVVLPETYQTPADSSIARMSWKDFFPDPQLKIYIDTALTHNHSLLQTLETVSIARSQARISKGALLPEISLGIGASIQRFGDYTMDGVGNSTTNTPDLPQEKHIPSPYKDLNIGVGFQWEADIWGKLTDKKRAAASRWLKSVEAQKLAQTLLISETANLYYDLIGLDRQKAVLEEAIKDTHAAYLLTNELMKEGEVSRLSVDQFLSRRMKLEAALLAVDQQIGETERAFALLLGKLPFEVKRSSFEEIRQASFPVQQGIPAELLADRPDIRAAELELLAAKSDTRAARKSFFPSLTLGGEGGFNAFDLSHWFSSPASAVYNLAAGLTAPIFKRNEIRSMWESAKSNQRIALLNYHYQALKAYQEVINLLEATQQTEKRKTLKLKESDVHHRSIVHANELFRTGFVGYLDVLSANERYLDCELELIELDISFCKLNTLLYRSLGGGCF